MLTGLLALSMLCGLLPQNTVNVSAATTAKTTVSSYGRLGTVDVGSKTKSGTWWKINVGNKTAFCLSLGKTCHTGNTYQVTDTHMEPEYRWRKTRLLCKDHPFLCE